MEMLWNHVCHRTNILQFDTSLLRGGAAWSYLESCVRGRTWCSGREAGDGHDRRYEAGSLA